MESWIVILATMPEMRAFFDKDCGVRYMELRDRRYTKQQLRAMSKEEYDSTEFTFFVRYRHKDLKEELRGIFTITGLKEKLRTAKGLYE